MAGGQPVSMANLKELRKYTKKHGIRIIHDMTRVAENAYFIQQREKGYEKVKIKDIVKEICSLTDGATMSAKRCIGKYWRFLAINDWNVLKKPGTWLWLMKGCIPMVVLPAVIWRQLP